MKDEETAMVFITFRVPETLQEMIQEEAARLSKKIGTHISRSACIRMIIERHLNEVAR
jgi:hypothetical protein